MTEQEIKMEMLLILNSHPVNLVRAKDLQKRRHDIIDQDADRQHEMIDKAFERFFGEKP